MTTTTTTDEGFLARHGPASARLRTYRWGGLRYDVLAAVSVAALVIPESLGYAGVAGLPPEVGLWAAPLATASRIVYAPTSIIAPRELRPVRRSLLPSPPDPRN